MSERLYRSRDDRMLAGVAGGLADRLGIDPSVVRIGWAILVLPTGFLAVLAYVVMAIIVPDQDDVERDTSMQARGWPPPVAVQPPTGAHNAGRAARRDRRQGSAAFLVGGSLIVLGTWFLLREYVPELDLSRFWPVAVVGFGIVLVILALGQRSHDHDGGSR